MEKCQIKEETSARAYLLPVGVDNTVRVHPGGSVVLSLLLPGTVGVPLVIPAIIAHSQSGQENVFSPLRLVDGQPTGSAGQRIPYFIDLFNLMK